MTFQQLRRTCSLSFRFANKCFRISGQMPYRILTCDSLWRPWYILITTCLQTYLIYAGISRYLAFKEQAFDMKYGGNWNPGPMHFSLIMLITAIVFFLLFIYTSLARTSNLANEGIIIGREQMYTTQFAWIPQYRVAGLDGSGASGNLYATANRVLERGDLVGGLVGDEDGVGGMQMSGTPYDNWSARSAPLPNDFGALSYPQVPPSFRSGMPASVVVSGPGVKGGWRRGLRAIWQRFTRNCMPTSSMMHLMTAYALYLSITPLQSQLIRHYAMPEEKIWNHDLSMIMSSIRDKTIVKQPNILAEPMTAEFFNLLFAFQCIALRYPCVFWRANHSFSFLFSFLLVLTGLQSIVEASTASVLVKLCWNRPSLGYSRAGVCGNPDLQGVNVMTQLPPVELITYDSVVEDSTGLQNMTALILSTCSSLLMICLSMTVFEYGTYQFTENVTNNAIYSLHQNAGLDRGTPTPLEVASDVTSSQAGWTGCKGSSDYPQSGIYSRSYVCHIVAVIGSLFILALKTPILVACIVLYQEQKGSLMLINFVLTVVLLGTWFISWFAFCLKPTWQFKPQGGMGTTQYLSHSAVLREVRGGGGGIVALRSGLCSDSGGVGGAGLPGTSGANPDPRTQTRLISSSPVYGCFHVDNGGMCRLPITPQPPPPPPGMTGESVAHPPNSMGPRIGQQSIDCCSDDMEEDSRQSGTNNYVCLQGTLNNPNALAAVGSVRSIPTTLSQQPSNQHQQQASLLCNNSSFSIRRSTTTDGTLPSPGSSFDPSTQLEMDQCLGVLKYAFRPSDVFSGPNVRSVNSFSQGVRETNATLSQSVIGDQTGGVFCPTQPSTSGDMLGKQPAIAASNGPRVTFKEEPSPITSESAFNPTSSNDSGIDNQTTALLSTNMDGGDVPVSTRFSTLPSVSRAGLHFPIQTCLTHPSEHTYYNQDQFSTPAEESTPLSADTTSSKRTFSFSEFPSMPPLNLPQNSAGEVSFASLSRLYNLEGITQSNATIAPNEGLMTRSAIVRESDDSRSGRLCSQV